MTQPQNPQHSDQMDLHVNDSDMHKGAVEGAPDDPGNANAQGTLDEGGMPHDKVAIAEDVLGANEDETQG